MCKPFFTIALLCSLTLAVQAQSPHDEVRAVVDLLFDRMRVGDTEKTAGR